MQKKPFAFTLLEVLIVVCIIGVATAVITFRSNNSGFRDAKNFADQLKSQMQIAREQAIAEMITIGLLFDDKNYEFYTFLEKPANRWIPLSEKDSFWKRGNIPRKTALNLISVQAVKTKDGKEIENQPRILFFPSGDMTAFKLTITIEGSAQYIQIIGDTAGTLQSEIISNASA